MTFSPGGAGAIYQRARAFTDVHFYQKWRAVWPQLARLPRRGVRLLDAGCGDGRWSIEIASRRPGWSVIGLDRDGAAVESARGRSGGLGLSNVSFIQGDFSEFAPAQPFDVVLSVCSSHYGPTASDTEQLFRRLREWLGPAGRLVLLAPRVAVEVPFVRRFKRPRWHDVFSHEGLMDLCRVSQLTAMLIAPCIGVIGTMAKQLDWARESTPAPTGGALALLARGLAIVDAHVPAKSRRSLMWLLVADREK